MKKTICKVDYDTETAELLGKVTALPVHERRRTVSLHEGRHQAPVAREGGRVAAGAQVIRP